MVNKSLKNCRDWAAEFRKWSGPHDRSELQESQYMMVVLDDEIERLTAEIDRLVAENRALKRDYAAAQHKIGEYVDLTSVSTKVSDTP